ncbi:integrase [Candidatus Marinamargulisbacteria bacterium SCGC AAA071-K20]|nr:integrase [Candidatus Marinamargulisbacteria bacterium SCGC AAA071-K20]
MVTMTTDTETENIQPAISAITKIFRKHHLNYDQIHYATKVARKNLDIQRNKNPKQKIDRLSKDDQKKLIQYAYSQKGDTGLLVKTLFFTGTRISEFVDLKIEDFFFDEEIVVVKNGKGNKQRTIPITNALAQEVQTHIGDRQTGYLFESRLHNKYSPRRIQQIVKALAKDSGITKKVHPHLLRHSIATYLLEHGMPLEQIQIFLGHERIENTRIYAKNSTEQIREEFKRAMKSL